MGWKVVSDGVKVSVLCQAFWAVIFQGWNLGLRGLLDFRESRDLEAVSSVREGIGPLGDIRSGRRVGNCASKTSPERKNNRKIRILVE